jgi:GDPmannose 4,6-dehydratase
MSKIAFITGITGQDGSYLAEFLLEKNYHVHGLIRRSSTINTSRIDHIFNNKNLFLHYGDLTDFTSLYTCLINIKNKYSDIEKFEVYNLGAQSHVKISFEVPSYTANVDANGTLNLLEAVRLSELGDKIKFYQASTSEMYGLVQEVPQTEKTPFYPRSPYGVAKLYSYWIVKNYRESYGLFTCNGILFNHESERRGHNFVTRKITIGLNKILNNEEQCLSLGNIDSLRDWGHAKDYIEGMWLMLQSETADDFVLSTGEMHSVREFIELAFKKRGFHIEWKGSGLDECGVDIKTGRILIRIDEKYFRPAEVDQLLGDSTKAKNILGWSPKIKFDKLVELMVDSDCSPYKEIDNTWSSCEHFN